jgi:hypothetical protein
MPKKTAESDRYEKAPVETSDDNFPDWEMSTTYLWPIEMRLALKTSHAQKGSEPVSEWLGSELEGPLVARLKYRSKSN